MQVLILEVDCFSCSIQSQAQAYKVEPTTHSMLREHLIILSLCFRISILSSRPYLRFLFAPCLWLYICASGPKRLADSFWIFDILQFASESLLALFM